MDRVTQYASFCPRRQYPPNPDAFETGDATYIAKALGVVARAKGMTEIAKKTGLSREQLYPAYPSFSGT